MPFYQLFWGRVPLTKIDTKGKKWVPTYSNSTGGPRYRVVNSSALTRSQGPGQDDFASGPCPCSAAPRPRSAVFAVFWGFPFCGRFGAWVLKPRVWTGGMSCVWSIPVFLFLSGGVRDSFSLLYACLGPHVLRSWTLYFVGRPLSR